MIIFLHGVGRVRGVVVHVTSITAVMATWKRVCRKVAVLTIAKAFSLQKHKTMVQYNANAHKHFMLVLARSCNCTNSFLFHL